MFLVLFSKNKTICLRDFNVTFQSKLEFHYKNFDIEFHLRNEIAFDVNIYYVNYKSEFLIN